MSILIQILQFRFQVSFFFLFTKWYKPIGVRYVKFYKAKSFKLSVLWLIHLEVMIPTKPDKELAKQYLRSRA